jgi:hypothetical protein
VSNQSAQVEIHPIVALNVAEKQILFDKNEKLLLAQENFQLHEIVRAQKAQIDELEAIISGKVEP